MDTTRRALWRTRWTWWVAIPAVLVLAMWAVSGMMAEGEPGPEDNTSTGMLRGELNDDARAAAETFGEFPLLWLGPEFMELQLTDVLREELDAPASSDMPRVPSSGSGIDAFWLFYGTCDPPCGTPLQIQISLAGVPPLAHFEDDDRHASITELRGVPSTAFGNHSTTMWLGGTLTVTVHGRPELRERAVQALQSANAETLGIPPVGPGDDLSGLSAGEQP